MTSAERRGKGRETKRERERERGERERAERMERSGNGRVTRNVFL